MKQGIIFAIVLLLILNAGCSSNSSSSQNEKNNIKDTTMAETFDHLKEKLADKKLNITNTSFEFNGEKHLATFIFDESQQGTRPGVLVVPEWWGLNDYVKTRAELIASLGYAALAIDPYGNGKTADNPADAGALTTPYYKDPALAVRLLQAAIEKIKTLPEVDTSRIGSVGYCFGGYISLSGGVADMGLKTSVGFHPSLGGVKPEGASDTKLLVCFGDKDGFEKDNAEPFKKRMDEAHIHYTFKTYRGAQHAFTNPDATAVGEKYNLPLAYDVHADGQSWEAMKEFLNENLKSGSLRK